MDRLLTVGSLEKTIQCIYATYSLLTVSLFFILVWDDEIDKIKQNKSRYDGIFVLPTSMFN